MSNYITIYTAQGKPKIDVTLSASSVCSRQIGTTDYIKLVFSLSTPLLFVLGDYAEWNGKRYICNTHTKPTYNTETASYKYELQLDAWYLSWSKRIFRFAPQVGSHEASWSYTATLDKHLDIILKNLTANSFYYNGLTGTGDTDISYYIHTNDIKDVAEAKVLTYSNTNIIEALNMMCNSDMWDCEWWINNNVIHVGKLYKKTALVNMSIGNNLKTITSSASATDYATRIYAFGSTRNIPSYYRKTLTFVSGGEVDITDDSKLLDYDYLQDNAFTGGQRYTETILKPASTITQVGEVGKATTIDGITLVENVTSGQYLEFIPNEDWISWSVIGTSGLASVQMAISLVATFSDATEQEINISSALHSDIVYSKDISSAVFDTVFVSEYSLFVPSGQSLKKMRLKAALTPKNKENTTVDYQLAFKVRGNVLMRVLKPMAQEVQITLSDGTNGTATFVPTTKRLTLNNGLKTKKGSTYTVNNLYKSEVPSVWWESEYDSLLVTSVVEEHLMLPAETGGYIDAEQDLKEHPENIVEAVVVFDDVYPKRESVITAIKTRTLYDKVEQKDGSYIREAHDAYRVYSAEQDFKRQYIIKGETLGIRFISGLLSGMEFDATFISSDEEGKQCFEVVRNDTYGRTLPDEILKPNVGDEYVLLNFDIEYVGDSYVPEAEKELQKYAEEYVQNSKIDPNTYECTMLSRAAYNLYKKSNRKVEYDLGQRVILANSAFFNDGSRESRVLGYEYKMDIPYDAPKYIIGEKPTYSRLGDLSKQVENVVYKGQTFTGISGNGCNCPKLYVIGANDNTEWTDSNILSARRVWNDFISKLRDEVTPYGLSVGKDLSVNGQATITDKLTVLATTYLQAIKALSLVDYSYKSGDAYSGGKGFALYNNNGKSTLEVDNLTVRLKAVFSELEIRKLSSVGGNIVLSAASSTIEHVTGKNGMYCCYLNADNGTMSTTNAWVVGDIVRCQTFNVEEGTNYNAHNKNYYGRVVSVGEDDKGKYINVTQALVDGSVGEPESGDVVVQMGNLIDTSRGNIIILTTSGENSPAILQYNGINDYNITPFLATQISPDGNVFRAKSFEFVTDSETSRIPNNRGKYDNTKSYNYYDEVTYNGSLWLCVNTSGANTNSVPSKTNTDWQILVEKGKDGADGGAYTCYFENPSIVIPANDNGQIENGYMTSSRYHVYYGGTDVSDNFRASVAEITGASAMLSNSELVLSNITNDGYCTVEFRSTTNNQILKATVSFVIIKGGVDGASLFTWIAYADDGTGNGFSLNPQGKAYIGIAYNKTTSTPSNDPEDYLWSKIKGEDGKNGTNGVDGTDGADGKPAYSASLSRSSAFVGVTYNNADYEKIAIQPILYHGEEQIPAKDIAISHNANINHCTVSVNNGTLTIASIANLKEGYSFDITISYKTYKATLQFRYEVVNIGFGTSLDGKGVSMYASYVDENNEVHNATLGVLAEDATGKTIVKLSGEQITLEGYTTINGDTHITEDGTLIANNAKIKGTVEEGSNVIENSLRTPFKRLYLDVDEGIINETSNTIISSTYDNYSGIWNVRMNVTKDFFLSFPSEYVAEELMLPTDASQIGRHVLLCSNKPKTTDSQVTVVYAPYEVIEGKTPSNTSFVGGVVSFQFRYGVVELLAIPNTESEKHCQWLIRNAQAEIDYNIDNPD